jgi:aspartyl-tRNA(Asn)/glutamyl-tRNA(Gln) amidotransferase subunit A
MSRPGAIPLSTTLDTIGPLARSVEDCALVFRMIAGEAKLLASRQVSGLRMAFPKGGMLERSASISGVRARLDLVSQAGANLADIDAAPLAEFQALNPNATIQAAEAMAWHGT